MKEAHGKMEPIQETVVEIYVIGDSSPLRNIALYFHMDWYLTGDPFASVENLLNKVDAEEAQGICSELDQLLSETLTDEQLLWRWVDLGASGWPMSHNVRNYLTNIRAELAEKCR